MGVGLGISANITFLSFIISDHWDDKLILKLHFFLIIFLILSKWWEKILKSQPHPAGINPQKLDLSLILISHQLGTPARQFGIFLFFLLTMAQIYYVFAQSYPFGEWDAWAVWNMKTKFLIHGHYNWKEVFNLHWHTQPDYPLFLPCLNTWFYSVAKAPLFTITLWTAIGTSLLTGGLLFIGLRHLTHPHLAWLASGLLLLHPDFIHLGTAQYADGLFSFYLLSSVMIFIYFQQEKDYSLATLLGLFLGFMTFIKNEGILICGLFSLIIFFNALSDKRQNLRIKISLLGCGLLGLFFSSFSTLLLKLFLAPPNRDMFLNNLSEEFIYFNWGGLIIIGNYIQKFLFSSTSNFIWLLLILMFFLKTKKFFENENKMITSFFILYCSMITLNYITTVHFDLNWRLIRTFPRILYYLLPSLLLFHFYVWWGKDKHS